MADKTATTTGTAVTNVTEYCAAVAKEMAGWGLDIVQWFLLASLVAALLWATVEIAAKVQQLRAKSGDVRPGPDDQQPAPLNAVITAIVGLIDALAKAPVWFALFVAGIALLWVNTETVSNACPTPAKAADQPNATASPAPGATPSGSASPARAPR